MGKGGLLPIHPGNDMAPLKPHSEVTGGERQTDRQRERTCEPTWAWGFAFIGVESGGLRFGGLTVYC